MILWRAGLENSEELSESNPFLIKRFQLACFIEIWKLERLNLNDRP